MTLFLMITHHGVMQLKIQLKNMPAGALYVALRLDKDVYTLCQHTVVSAEMPSTWSGEDELSASVQHSSRAHDITVVVLCCDANLGNTASYDMSERVLSLMHLVQPFQCLFYSQEVNCIKNAHAYLSALKEGQPGYKSIVCTHDVFRKKQKHYFSRLHAGEFDTQPVWDHAEKEEYSPIVCLVCQQNQGAPLII